MAYSIDFFSYVLTNDSLRIKFFMFVSNSSLGHTNVRKALNTFRKGSRMYEFFS